MRKKSRARAGGLPGPACLVRQMVPQYSLGLTAVAPSSKSEALLPQLTAVHVMELVNLSVSVA